MEEPIMNSSERNILLKEIKRLEDALTQEREENRILKERINSINTYKDEYEKLIAEVKEELQAAKEMKEYFGKLKQELLNDIEKL